MFSSLKSAQTIGVEATIVDTQIDVSKGGMQSFSIVGLPDKAVEESRDRVHAAIKNSKFKGPKSTNYKTVVSLAPASIKKEGPVFDLSIALAFLLTTKQIRFRPERTLFLGELSLSGTLHGIKGTLPIVEEAKKRGFTSVFLPKENAKEAALIRGVAVYGAESLAEVILHLNEKNTDEDGMKIPPQKIKRQPQTQISTKTRRPQTDFGEIKGQESAKRALEIAAAGGHNIAMYGPPGTGKTMLARCFRDILPDPTFEDMLEITRIHSISRKLNEHLLTEPPFRAPHHSASFVSLVGGGTKMLPGEITLAHRGVLFLDEFPEFDRRSVEALRQPIEDRTVCVTRANGSVTYPANFIFVAAMNPCPCGNFGNSGGKPCTCTPAELARYRRKLSGPIVDRVDLWVSVGRVDPKELKNKSDTHESDTVRAQVKRARGIQKDRFEEKAKGAHLNSEMTNADIRNRALLSAEAEDTLQKSLKKLNISARGYYRIIKTARTIADLEDSNTILPEHILEALQYRPRNIL